MNRQQRSLLIAIASMVALVLIVILIIGLNQRGPEPPLESPEPLATTDTFAPAPEGTWQPLSELSEEEMGRQAMSEEEQREGEDELPED
ncbi:MAG: hypothetical protein FWD25_10645 [Clostridia bacterium]|nr:hypothetical protein [Clostridia bacterium]